MVSVNTRSNRSGSRFTSANCSGFSIMCTHMFPIALSVVSPPATSSRLENALMSSLDMRAPSTSAMQSFEIRSSPGIHAALVHQPVDVGVELLVALDAVDPLLGGARQPRHHRRVPLVEEVVVLLRERQACR